MDRSDKTRDKPALHNETVGFATRAIHFGYDPLLTKEKAVNPPLFMTASYAFESAEAGAETFAGLRDGYIYGRTRNPTQTLLEQRVAELEGAEAGLALASGMGAISATCWTLLKAGDRVVVDHMLYGNTFALFSTGLPKFGVDVVLADFTKLDALEGILKAPGKAPPRFVYFETPANPNLRVIDIAAVSRLAKAVGALTVIDSTFCSPAIQRPIELGADVVIHSATKFLGGHGDLISGLVLGPAAIVKQIRMHGVRYLTGATVSPMTCFLILRGLKTLALRMERHAASALALATMLEAHPAVSLVAYPGLRSHPQYAVARRQMASGGGLISFELAGGYDASVRFLNAVRLATRAVSLGDAETLIQHPASMTHAQYSAAERAAVGLSDSLIRLSVGLEDVSDLERDLTQALQAASAGRSG